MVMFIAGPLWEDLPTCQTTLYCKVDASLTVLIVGLAKRCFQRPFYKVYIYLQAESHSVQCYIWRGLLLTGRFSSEVCLCRACP